jgi:hypothetical protein
MMIYDADNNDLGVRLSTDALISGSVSLKALTGRRVYILPEAQQYASVIGLRAVNAGGEEVEVYAEDEGNGVWSFEMPMQAVTVSPVYSTTKVVLSNGGNTI